MIGLKVCTNRTDAAIDQNLSHEGVADTCTSTVAFPFPNGKEASIGEAGMIPLTTIVVAFQLRAQIPTIERIPIAAKRPPPALKSANWAFRSPSFAPPTPRQPRTDCRRDRFRDSRNHRKTRSKRRDQQSVDIPFVDLFVRWHRISRPGGGPYFCRIPVCATNVARRVIREAPIRNDASQWLPYATSLREYPFAGLKLGKSG